MNNNGNIFNNNQKPIEKKQNINIDNKISASEIRSNRKEGTKREMISPIIKIKPKAKSNKSLLFLIISLFALLLVGILITYLVLKYQKKEPKEEENIDHKIKVEKAMKVFKPSFKINSKTNELTQILFKSIKQYITLSDEIESSYSIYSKSKYDIYTLNESLSEKDKNFYNRKYTSVITLNSFCTKLLSNSSENDCELQKYLDLNIKNANNFNNLRRNDEVDKEKMKDVILPICIIEHTDTNLMLSITCPEQLSQNLKNDIILAFNNIKPDTIKSLNVNETMENTIIEEKDDKTYIKSFSKECINYEGNPQTNMKCEMNRDIITDKEGNLLFSKNISITENIKDNNNKYINNFTYISEDISKQNKDGINIQNYKTNLNIIMDLTKSLMIKENLISDDTFNELLEDLIKDEDNNTEFSNLNNNIRNLDEDNSKNKGIFEDTFFSKTINNINIALNLKNDIGLKSGDFKAISEIKIGDQTQEILENEVNAKFSELLNIFISITKSGNKLANKLYNQLNEPLLELRDIINSNITELNNILVSKDLLQVFGDSTKSSKQLNDLPYKFIVASENLYIKINELNKNMPNSIEKITKELSNDISSFIERSHELISNIFKNLAKTTNSLSSINSKIAEISSYYLNHTDTSYVGIIQMTKEILNNYYINEKNLIVPMVDDMLNKYYDIINNDSELKYIRLILSNIMDKLNNGTLLIHLANKEDYKKAINYLNNSNIILDQMIINIKNKVKESIGLKNNGYFETEKDIENNQKLYGEVSNKAMDISYILDNNLLIDKAFDKIMIYFRDQFIVLLKYIEQSKQDKFTIKENILSNSIFDPSNINQINNNLKNSKMKTLNYIINENNKYLNLIQNELSSFKNNYQANVENIFKTIISTDSYIINLQKKYNEILNKIINSINSVIEYNNNLSKDYLTKVKNAGPNYRTQGFINNYNKARNSIIQTKNFIQNNLRNPLTNKYRNVINQIRNILQTIKSNTILQKYIKQLPYLENHLKTIDNYLQKFDNIFSDLLFNRNYLPIINNNINNSINKLNTYDQQLINLYNTQASLPYSADTNYDYIKVETYSYRCCKFKLGRCWKHKTCHKSHNVGHKVGVSLNLQTVQINSYINEFDKLYGDIYNKLSQNINTYNTIFKNLDIRLENIKKNILSTNNNYLNDITNNVESIIINKLGTNLLLYTYNYYKNDINKNLPNELNLILEKWKDIYNYVYNYLNSNVNTFKSSINDFYLISTLYLNIYSQNISLDYSDSIVNKFKLELNYTINYYYNVILSKINNTYSYILNNRPINEYPFNEILNKRTNEIKNLYNNFINKIKASRNYILQKQNQLSIIKTRENDFFNINSFIKTNINNINQQLGAISKNMGILVDKNAQKYTEDSIIARFYLENAENGKQIKENYESVNKDIFIDLRNDFYKNIIAENMEIEQNELINYIINNEKVIKINAKNTLKQKILNNFKEVNNNFMSNFGKNYFDRILGYNEIQKIKSLYSNIQYSLSQTIKYYISLCKIQIEKNLSRQLPEDIKTKILLLNDLNSIIKIKNQQILTSLNKKLELLIKDTYSYVIEKYINNIKLQLNNNDIIKGFVIQNINEIKYSLQNEYNNLFIKIIKNPFIEQYTKIINKETSDMNNFIQRLKIEAKEHLNKIFTLKTDTVLSDIEKKLTETIKAITEYYSHFTTFKISNYIQNYLYNYGNNIIYPKYKEIKVLIDDYENNYELNSLNYNYETFIKDYSIEKFENKNNIINDHLNNNFNKINEYLRNYGAINNEYEINLEKEINNFNSIRRLDNLDKTINNQNEKFLNIDISFEELEKTSLNNKEFIQSYNLLDDTINKYINNLKIQYTKAENIINKKKYYDESKIILDKLYNISMNYYTQANITYYKMKSTIIKSIFSIDELIQKSKNITVDTITKKYIKIKNNFSPIKMKINKTEESINLKSYNLMTQENNFRIDNKMINYNIGIDFTLDIIFENNDLKKPKIFGKIINNNKPQKYLIDYYSTFCKCGRFGKNIEVTFNNISFSTDMIFDGTLNILQININSDFDAYLITTKYYEDEEVMKPIILNGVELQMSSICKSSLKEEYEEIVSSKNSSNLVKVSYL